MKIIIVGATGTIGRHVTAALEKEHQVIKVGSKSGDFQVDISSPTSITQLFEQVGSFDALISTTGHGHFGPLASMTDKDFKVGINGKLMGQVNLVLIGQQYINPKGSFTISSGSLSEDPIFAGVNLSTVNGALDSFVKSAAIELANGVRINAVSPTVVEESPEFFPYFPGQSPVTMASVTQAYIRSVLGPQTGQIYKVH